MTKLLLCVVLAGVAKGFHFDTAAASKGQCPFFTHVNSAEDNELADRMNEADHDGMWDRYQGKITGLLGYQTPGAIMSRGNHATGWCLDATWTPVKSVGCDWCNTGVFALGNQAHAKVRFSIGGPQTWATDNQFGLRAMAIKLFEQEGARVHHIDPDPIPEEENAKTQDFLMISSTTFLGATAEGAVDLAEDVARASKMGIASFAFRHPVWMATGTKHSIEGSYLTNWFQGTKDGYWSATPYRLGEGNDHAVKYFVKLCDGFKLPKNAFAKGEHIYTKNIEASLAAGDVCMEFRVQPMQCGENVEDSTQDWTGPTFKVAELTFKMQPTRKDNGPGRTPPSQVKPEEMMCENLFFSPYHALAVHEPLGQFNRVRQSAYNYAAGLRRKENEANGYPTQTYVPPANSD